MIIKSPPVYDTSHWKLIPDFSLINPRPVLMLTKATESVSYVDQTFVKYFEGMRNNGIARGCFHFFRKNSNVMSQAAHFIQTVKPHVTDKDILVLDVEEGGETASQLWSWLYETRRAFPNNQFMIYSRKNVLDAIVMTPAEKDYFKQIPVWTAGYPYFPDLFATPPAGYIPDQSKYGPVWLWQYSSSGVVSGISGDVDLNWINPVFYELIRESLPPTRRVIAELELHGDGTITGTWE